MSFTRNTFVSSESGISTADETSTSSATYSTTVQSSSPDGSDSLAAGYGGEAVAVGDDTLAAGSVSASMVDEGNITTVSGTATAVAASEDSDGAAFASADTFAQASGADFVLVTNRETDSTEASGTGTVAISTSTTTLTAYDLQLSDGGGATSSGSGSPDAPAEANDQPGSSTASTTDGGGVDLEGNIATVEFDAEAIGDDSFVTVDAFALTVEGELSVAAVDVVLAVD
jgi:hypothetical protein